MIKSVRIRRSNFIAYVDDEDYDLVRQYKWYLYPYRAPTYYTCTNKAVFMHRLIMPAPKGLMTCHVDGNGLNNQRSNLIVQSHEENMQNKRLYNNNTSGVTGVKHNSTYIRRLHPWEAQITVRKKRIYLGCFKTFEQACEARFVGELKYKGEEDD